jgi:hypothetical protein
MPIQYPSSAAPECPPAALCMGERNDEYHRRLPPLHHQTFEVPERRIYLPKEVIAKGTCISPRIPKGIGADSSAGGGPAVWF